MFKSIPKSFISRRSFKTHKEWRVDNTEYPVISASLSSDTIFISESSDYQQVYNTKIYSQPYYNSIKSKYYTGDGNLINLFGKINNPFNFSKERSISNTIYTVKIDQNRVGEEIKPLSFRLFDQDNSLIYVDDGNGNVVNELISYTLISFDLENSELVLSDGINNYEFEIISFDLNTGLLDLVFQGDSTPDKVVNSIDFEQSLIYFNEELSYDNLELTRNRFGNIFYDEGLVVFTNDLPFQNYELTYNSTHTIHETEVLCSVEEHEFNFSQNPTAVEVIVSGSYEFTTTPITNVRPAETKKITQIQDIRVKQSFSGSYNPFITGSWDDYENLSPTDPTGSYLAPYITTIGLYDDNNQMVAVAKLPKPIKSYPDLPLNFIVRFDT